MINACFIVIFILRGPPPTAGGRNDNGFRTAGTITRPTIFMQRVILKEGKQAHLSAARNSLLTNEKGTGQTPDLLL